LGYGRIEGNNVGDTAERHSENGITCLCAPRLGGVCRLEKEQDKATMDLLRITVSHADTPKELEEKA
jgi:hypothetical protein